MPTHYEILGVDPEADEGQIKSAYRKKALQLHPDVNRQDADADIRFKELSEAYVVLKDERKRRDYDARLRLENRGSGNNLATLDDILSSVFGSDRREVKPRKKRKKKQKRGPAASYEGIPPGFGEDETLGGLVG